MRTRPSARLFVINSNGEVLLFRFEHKAGALEGQTYWATPGGGVEEGESFEQAAKRELFEETGFQTAVPLQEVGRNQFTMQLPDGETVLAQERYFHVTVNDDMISENLWSEEEKRVIAKWHWWRLDDLAKSSETVFPQNMTEILTSIL